MSISDTARIDALFKKLQGRTNTGYNTNITNEGSSISHVFTPQVGLQNVPLTQPTDAIITSTYPWITKRTAIAYTTLVANNTVAGYRAYSNTLIKDIIPYYTITVTVAGATLTRDQYILDFDTGIIVIYTVLVGAPTITCYTYNGGYVETLGPTIDGSGNLLVTAKDLVISNGNLVVGKAGAAFGTPNEVIFGGTSGDTPARTKVVERIYQTGTEKSELLLWKGDDALAPSGPDRIRLKAAETRIQVSGATSDPYADASDMLVVNNMGVQIYNIYENIGVSTSNSISLYINVPATMPTTDKLVELKPKGNKSWIYFKNYIIIAPMFGPGFYEIDYCNNWSAGHLRLGTLKAVVWWISRTEEYKTSPTNTINVPPYDQEAGAVRWSMKRITDSWVNSRLWLAYNTDAGDVGNSSTSSDQTYGFVVGSIVTTSQYNFRIRFSSASF
jgi:hypothetical protein